MDHLKGFFKIFKLEKRKKMEFLSFLVSLNKTDRKKWYRTLMGLKIKILLKKANNVKPKIGLVNTGTIYFVGTLFYITKHVCSGKYKSKHAFAEYRSKPSSLPSKNFFICFVISKLSKP
jgi:hypothetical protein